MRNITVVLGCVLVAGIASAGATCMQMRVEATGPWPQTFDQFRSRGPEGQICFHGWMSSDGELIYDPPILEYDPPLEVGRTWSTGPFVMPGISEIERRIWELVACGPVSPVEQRNWSEVMALFRRVINGWPPNPLPDIIARC